MTNQDDKSAEELLEFISLPPDMGGRGGLDDLAEEAADAEARMAQEGGRANVARSIASKLNYSEARAEVEAQRQQEGDDQDQRTDTTASSDEPDWKVLDPHE